VHAGVVQHGPGGVAETETAHSHVQGRIRSGLETEPRELDLRRGEETRHEELVTQLDLVHVDTQEGISPSS
jgi:hypothetical protein